MLFPIELIYFDVGERIYEHAGGMLWWMWVFVPPLIICHVTLLLGYFMILFREGVSGDNQYGPEPFKPPKQLEATSTDTPHNPSKPWLRH